MDSMLRLQQGEEPDSASSSLQSYSSSRLYTNTSVSSRSFPCSLADMAACDVDRTICVFDFEKSSDPASSRSDSYDASGIIVDNDSRNENIGPTNAEVVSSTTKQSAWYCTHDWTLQYNFS